MNYPAKDTVYSYPKPNNDRSHMTLPTEEHWDIEPLNG